MTETYQSLGTTTPVFYAFLGAGFVAVAFVIALIRRIRRAQAFPAQVVNLLGIGSWLIISWAILLPMFLSWIGFGIGPLISSIFKITPSPTKLRKVPDFVVLVATAAVLVDFTLWVGDRRITLTANNISVVGTGAMAHRRDFRGVVAKKDLYIDVTDYGADFFQKDFVEWRIGYMKKSANDIYILGNTTYWGPHGLITSDQLGKRIAAWSGVAPHVHPFSWNDDDKQASTETAKDPPESGLNTLSKTAATEVAA